MVPFTYVTFRKASPDVKKSENPHFLSNVVINATCARNVCPASSRKFSDGNFRPVMQLYPMVSTFIKTW